MTINRERFLELHEGALPQSVEEIPFSHVGVVKDQAREKRPAVAYAAMYAQLVWVARSCGYALAVHGSLISDCDLIAAAWVADAEPAETLVKRLADAAAGHVLGQTEASTVRPHGRRSYLIHLGAGPYLDIAVFGPTKDGAQ